MENEQTTEQPTEKPSCTFPGCDQSTKAKGLCQRHYDQWYGKIRQERAKLKQRDKPFLRFENPYREGSGYHIVFEVIRQNQPLTTEQILHRAKIELAKAGKSGYRVDYAFEVLRMRRHACKRGDYQMRQDAKGRWIVIRDRISKSVEANGDNT
jgi:hypothetical protein